MVSRPGRHPPRRGPGPGLRRRVLVLVEPTLRTPVVGRGRVGIRGAGSPLIRLRALDSFDGQLTMNLSVGTARSSAKVATSLLILSPKAGSMTPEIEAKLRKAFATSLIVEFDPKLDIH